MNFHSTDAANVAAWREKAEYLEEENKLLREALTPKPTRLPAYKRIFDLSPMQGRVLDALIEANGDVVSRHRIALNLYGLAAAPKDGNGDPRVVDIILTKLRYKLRVINPELEIKNSWSLGWRIAPHHRSIIFALVGEASPMMLPPN